MRIKSLKINNLRNISCAEIVPHERLNVLHGENGAGKTSVIEALVILGKGRSFRTGHISTLIGPETNSFMVTAQTRMATDEVHQLGLERTRGHWQARIDGRDVEHISELAEYLPFVLMEPNSHLLVSGTPDVRRKFMDWGVFHVKHEFLPAWRRYTHAMRQRNAALRAGDERVVRSLEPQLSQYGHLIDASRRQLTEDLVRVLRTLGDAFLPGGKEVSLNYEPGWRGDSLEQALHASRQRDMERGATHCGPHRAELDLCVDGKPARERLSRGEQKLLAASLLFAQARILATRQLPILLLDDLASEFDAGRMADVLASGREMGAQIWLTGTRAEDYLDFMAGDGLAFHVKQGHIYPG